MSKYNLLWKRRQACALFATGVAAAFAVALSGCGGDKVNPNVFGNIPDTTPAVYGLDPFNNSLGVYGADSSLVTTDETGAFATAATASNSTIASTIAVGGTVPFGFAPGGATSNGTLGHAVTPGTNVVFRAALANGTQSGKNVPIVPSSVTLTSPEAGLGAFSQALSFNDPKGGIVPSATYRSGTFTLPFTTTGLHTLRVNVSDTAGRTTFTDFGVVVLAGTDAAMLAQVTDTDGVTPIAGATVALQGTSVTGTTDAAGMVLLFAPAGTYTVSVTSDTATFTTTETLTAGTLLSTMKDDANKDVALVIAAPES